MDGPIHSGGDDRPSFLHQQREGCLIRYAVIRALVAATSIITATFQTAGFPAFSQGSPQFPILEISATTETSRTASAAVLLAPSSGLQTYHSAAEADWLELSYSPTGLSDQLVASPMGEGTLTAACDTAPLNALAPHFAACSAFNAPISGDWALSFQSKAWNGAVDSGGWRVNALLHDVTIAAASDLSTPLDQFNVAATSGVLNQITSELGISNTSAWGISVRTNSGLEVISTSAGVQAYQHVTITSADLFAGITPLGSLVGVEATFSVLSFSGAALDLDGQFQTAATVSLHMGDFTLSHVDGPGESGITGLFRHGPFNIGFSVNSFDLGATFEYDLEDSKTLKGWWSGLNGFQVAFVASIGPGSPVTVPLGAGSLSLAPPRPGSSTPAFRLRWPLSAAMPTLPSQPLAAAPPSSVVLPATGADTE